MPKLNDTQTILLSTASQRDNLSLYPLPDLHAKAGPRVIKAIAAMLAGGLLGERETSATDQIARSEGDISYGLYLTPAGLAAIGIDPDASSEADQQPTPPPERATKAAIVLALLRREAGATLPELIEATGWLPHTTRAALTGLRKKGHSIDKAKRDSATCYRIVAAG